MNKFIYHYTNSNAVTGILKDGEIKVCDCGVDPPAVWLSLNAEWENTALKMIKDNGSLRLMTKKEQNEKFGLYRFSLPFNKDKLCSWKEYRKKSSTSRICNKMEIASLSQDSFPVQWYASLENIPLSECIACEKWKDGKWKTFVSLENHQ